QWPADDDHIGSEFTTQPWLFSTSAAWLCYRMHGGTIPVRTHLRGPRTSLCLLDDPVTFAINEDHAPKIRSCKYRPLCEAREDEIAHSICVDCWRTRWSVLSARSSALHREGSNPSP